MKIFPIFLLIFSCSAPRLVMPSRVPASTQSEQIEKLIEIDQRRGCCSHHGGVSFCSNGNLYCNDGWVSGCGC